MPAFNEAARKKANQAQREKYGEGYGDEMRRRQSLRKTKGTGGFRWLKKNDPEKFRKIIQEREKNRDRN